MSADDNRGVGSDKKLFDDIADLLIRRHDNDISTKEELEKILPQNASLLEISLSYLKKCNEGEYNIEIDSEYVFSQVNFNDIIEIFSSFQNPSNTQVGLVKKIYELEGLYPSSGSILRAIKSVSQLESQRTQGAQIGFEVLKEIESLRTSPFRTYVYFKTFDYLMSMPNGHKEEIKKLKNTIDDIKRMPDMPSLSELYTTCMNLAQCFGDVEWSSKNKLNKERIENPDFSQSSKEMFTQWHKDGREKIIREKREEFFEIFASLQTSRSKKVLTQLKDFIFNGTLSLDDIGSIDEFIYEDIPGYHILNKFPTRGGFKQPYLAVDKDDGSICVVSQYLPDERNEEYLMNGSLDIENIRRADRLSNPMHLTHENLRPEIPISGKDGWVIQKYYKRTLREEIQKDFNEKGFLHKAKIQAIAIQVLKGIGHLHKFDIIHGDVSTKNIGVNDFKENIYEAREWLEKITREWMSEEANIMICDLGSAHKEGEKIKDIRRILGSRSIRAPEANAREIPSKCVDYWAFGCVLYEMLTGHESFSQSERMYLDDIYKVIRKSEIIIDSMQKESKYAIVEYDYDALHRKGLLKGEELLTIHKEYDTWVNDKLKGIDNEWANIIKDCWVLSPEKREQKVYNTKNLLEKIMLIGDTYTDDVNQQYRRQKEENDALKEQLRMYKARFGELDE